MAPLQVKGIASLYHIQSAVLKRNIEVEPYNHVPPSDDMRLLGDFLLFDLGGNPQ